MKEENLIFIISQPRSGSTYLQNLLSNNEETNTCSEPWILLNFPNLLNPKLVQAKFDNGLANRAFTNYKNKFGRLEIEEKQKRFLLDLYSPLIMGFNFVIDKTPRYWEIIDEIQILFPQSKIILIKRHPIEVAKSMMKVWNLKALKDFAPYKRDLLLAPYKLDAFEKKNIGNPNFYSIRYESLIENVYEETKKIYEWIGIPFSSAVLDTTGNTKFKGEFGDPYQNSKIEYSYQKLKKENSKMSSQQKQFLKGYGAFFGKDFLLDYGSYSVDSTNYKQDKNFSFATYHYFKGDLPIVKSFQNFIKHLFFGKGS